MAGMIAKQPNGRYCRFSTVVDTFTHINMTAEDYVFNVTGGVKDIEDGIDTLERHLYDWDYILEQFMPNNISQEEFDKLVDECIMPANKMRVV